MDLRDLILALMTEDALVARQWIIDANRGKFDWRNVPQPTGLKPDAMAVAAGIVELLAARAHQSAPAWILAVPSATEPVWLVSMFANMPRTRKLCEEHGPEPLRRRNVFAPPEFLTAA